MKINSKATPPPNPSRNWDAAIVRYPDPAIEVIDERFAPYRLEHAAVERLATGFRWVEGPVWWGDGGYLLFSDIPNNRMMRWFEDTGQVTVFRQPSNNSNGNTRDREGRLVTCEHDSRRVTRMEHDGNITVLMDCFQGKRLNAPNDVVVKSDGSVWFTDPGYGILMNYEGHKAPFELPTQVYRLDPDTGDATVVADDMKRPNGLCFSPDESRIYIVDTGVLPRVIRVYDLVDGIRLAGGRVFIDLSPGSSDGIRCDTDGNLWTAAGHLKGEGMNGVRVYAPDGQLIGRIHLPEICANLCFGGRKRNRLFMAASQSIYALYVEAQGAQVP